MMELYWQQVKNDAANAGKKDDTWNRTWDLKSISLPKNEIRSVVKKYNPVELQNIKTSLPWVNLNQTLDKMYKNYLKTLPHRTKR